MTAFNVSDQVLLPRPYRGVVGTVIYYDQVTNRYLVRVGIEQQLYFTAEQLTKWSAAAAKLDE
ncbi:hypothetical protein [Levilactobacillus spicheri]|jgi:hypothetical protein|uniref:Uncharacterized protein n=1 Tax=Levilactobacillus spicheri TaxID=216463 RepID=A0A0F3RUT2_9LACO|nr:hypothetical protein [Levilactobacillus spicheri]KJW13665.1 hypothetical protein VC81_01865 [Levilactobacillus spicheri]GEO66796.1 hypothetical protein LSP04_12150 [Levilactobacillus spicheri]